MKTQAPLVRKIGAAARRAYSRPAVQSKAGRAPLTPGRIRKMVILLDGPQDSVYSALVRIYAPANPKNLEANLGMTQAQAITAIGKARYYWTKGTYRRARAAYPSLSAAIAKDMGKPELSGPVKKLLFFLEEIKAPTYPELEKYLTSADYSAIDTITSKARRAGDAVSSAAGETKERTKQAARETFEDVTSAIKTGAGELDKALPWYLKPKVLLPAAAVAALLVYGGPLLSLLPKPRKATKYTPNPLKGKAAAAAELYQKFHDKKPAKRVSIPAIDTSELVQLGKGLEIGYRSKKWTGKNENYLHKFGPGVKLLATADGKNLVVTGGSLDITPAGIVG